MERAGKVDASARIAAGTPEFRRTNIAIFFCGFSIFAILYCTQPVLPLFSETFGVSAAESSLALSLTTATMAFAILFASSLSEVVGRKSMMLGALLASSALTFVLAFAQDWSQVLWLRALAGVALSGMPAVALAYLAEEMEPKAVASAVGIYIGGGAFGGMSGRLITAALADYGSWRLAIAVLALTGFASAVVFWRALPRESLPVAACVWLVRHEFFHRDFALIRELGQTRDATEFYILIEQFRDETILSGGWLRNTFRLRVSGRRLRRLRWELR